MDPDWTDTILIIFFTCVGLAVVAAIVGLRYVRKFFKWLFKPVTTSSPRR